MDYTLTIAQRPGYLHAVVTGQNNSTTVARYMEDIMRECAARGVLRVLIEEHLQGPRLGMMEVFSLVSKGSVRFQRALEAMAYVDANAEGDMMRFAEDVAVNRGFPVRIFNTVAAAEEWLTEDDPGGPA